MGGGDYPLIYVSENTTYVVHACGLIFDVCSIDGSEISGERGVTIWVGPLCRLGVFFFFPAFWWLFVGGTAFGRAVCTARGVNNTS